MIAALIFAAAFTVAVWFAFDTTGAKSAGPPPHIPPGLDLDAFVAKVAGVESERRGRTS